jgi:hypothetical protein
VDGLAGKEQRCRRLGSHAPAKAEIQAIPIEAAIDALLIEECVHSELTSREQGEMFALERDALRGKVWVAVEIAKLPGVGVQVVE